MKILSRIILLLNLAGPTLVVALVLWFGLLYSIPTGSIFLPVLLLLDYLALVGITILHLVCPRRSAFWLALLLAVPFYFGVARSEMFVWRSTSRARACVDPADLEVAEAACAEVRRDVPTPHVARELAHGLRNLDDPDRKLEVVTLLRDLDVRDDEEVDAALGALFQDARTRPNGEKLAAAAFDAIRELDTLGTRIRGDWAPA